MTDRVRALVGAGLLAICATWILAHPGSIHAMLVAARPTRELVPVPDSVRHWWAATARCLTGDTAWRGARLFVGGRAPRGFPPPDDPHGITAGGINPATNALWVRSLTPATVSHQMAHMRLWPGVHPAFAFPAGGEPLCGLTGPP